MFLLTKTLLNYYNRTTLKASQTVWFENVYKLSSEYVCNKNRDRILFIIRQGV